jgi:iron complex outermembrane receptor protein
VEHELRPELTLAASARLDVHSEYGTQLSPRLSALYRPGPWTVRASLGRGFYAPTPFVEEIEAAGLSRLEPLSGLEAETAATASLDVGYARGPMEASVTLFASDIAKATRLETVAADRVRLVNVEGRPGYAGPSSCCATAGTPSRSPAATSMSTRPSPTSRRRDEGRCR